MGKKKKSALQVILEDGWYHCEMISVCMLPNTGLNLLGLPEHTVLYLLKIVQIQFAWAGDFCQSARLK